MKLNYKILGRRPLGEIVVSQDGARKVVIEAVSVEWRHDDGPISDTVMMPTNHPPIRPEDPPIQYAETKAGERTVILDQINVPTGTPDSVVAMILEEKRTALATCLRIEP
jgi:hypothetical protein